MRILTRDEIRSIDRLSADEFGVPTLLLMENAGMRVVEAMEARIEDFDACAVVIVSGKGNNGGDGFVVARQLIQKGIFPETFLLARPEDVTGDARVNLDILTAIGHPPTSIPDAAVWERHSGALLSADVIVDAVLGTGVSRPADGLVADVIRDINDAAFSSWVVSVDVPSGTRADTGDLEGPAVEADLTVTLTALKHCLVFPPSGFHAGEVVVADIGNPHQLTDSVSPRIELIDAETFLDAFVSRDEDSQKGDYGKILVLGGSEGKAGAPALTSRAALRSGGGLVTAAVPAPILSTVAAFTPEVMTLGFSVTPDGSIAEGSASEFGQVLAGMTVVAVGPGLGTSEGSVALVRQLVRDVTVPLVLDADGINAFAGEASALGDRPSESPLVITPHPGEMARLIGSSVPEILRDRLGVASRASRSLGIYVILKGFRTVIGCPDGTAYVNSTGNAGMATAGSGDVLTGMLAGILGQPHLGSFEERLCLAVYLHGLAGDIGVDELGEESLVATDILRFLPAAWDRLRGA